MVTEHIHLFQLVLTSQQISLHFPIMSSLKLLFIYSKLIQQIFIEHLLCVRHCSKLLGDSNKQNKYSCPCEVTLEGDRQ